MFRKRVSGQGAAVIVALALWMVATPGRAAAQGPPDGLPGRGPVVLEGDLEVVFEDDNAGGRLLRYLASDNRRIPLRFRDGAAPDLPSGTRVRVTGTLADGLVDATNITVLAVSPSQSMGTHSVLVILVNFSNNPTQPYTPATAASVNGSVRNFYLENTYNQTYLNFTVTGWYTIAATNTSCSYTTWAAQADAAATNAGVNLAAYGRRIYAFPQASACSWWGLGYLGGTQAFVNGSYAVRVVSHELGHTFGLYHSHSLPCATTCTANEYGDDRDMMGVPGTVGHMNAFQKERMGWLNYGGSPTIATVTASGDYWIQNYEMLGGGPKALKIWNAAANSYYYVESRARVGFDANVGAGVTMHTGGASGDSSFQIDLAPTTTTFDTTLDVGQVFADAAMGMQVQTLSVSNDASLVRVTLSTPPCVTSAPTVSLAPSLQSGGAGYPVSYSVTVRNNNGSTCSPSAFNLAATVPSGWLSSVSGSGLASVAPGASATATLAVASAAGSYGSYSFPVTAADTAGGGAATTSGTLNVLAGLTVVATPSVSISKNAPSITVTTVVTSLGIAVASANVTATVIAPNGTRTTLTGLTATTGIVTLKHTLKRTDPSGTYQIQVQAAKNGATGSVNTVALVVK
jgi:hypothetical protein